MARTPVGATFGFALSTAMTLAGCHVPVAECDERAERRNVRLRSQDIVVREGGGFEIVATFNTARARAGAYANCRDYCRTEPGALEVTGCDEPVVTSEPLIGESPGSGSTVIQCRLRVVYCDIPTGAGGTSVGLMQ